MRQIATQDLLWVVEEGGPASSLTEIRTAANARLRSVVDEIADVTRTRAWRFFCECGRPDCDTLVRLRPDEFDELARSGEAVLANGHTPVAETGERLENPEVTEVVWLRETTPTMQDSPSSEAPVIRMTTKLTSTDALDAGEDVGRLLNGAEELDVSTACRGLLYALDQAITTALAAA